MVWYGYFGYGYEGSTKDTHVVGYWYESNTKGTREQGTGTRVVPKAPARRVRVRESYQRYPRAGYGNEIRAKGKRYPSDLVRVRGYYQRYPCGRVLLLTYNLPIGTYPTVHVCGCLTCHRISPAVYEYKHKYDTDTPFFTHTFLFVIDIQINTLNQKY